jgi:hypothetical protein
MARIARQQVITKARAGRGTGGGRVPPAGLVTGRAAGPVTGRASRDADGDGELTRESAGEGDRDPASQLALEEVIAATVHALTAVMEDGAIVASEVAGTRVGGIHIPGAHGATDHGGEGH